ncbi:MAG TPA: proprotein convertase P-domain-containing protein [Gaiellaceae bacterium]|nr:proprotein convertase P-domain-containing protein [Gaiellaceae bacterium]
MSLSLRALLVGALLCAVGLTAPSAFAATDYSNNSGVNIPDTSVASPYPSTIDVTGNGGVVTNVTVTLHNLTHTCSSDLNIVLEAPNGSTVWLAAQSGPCTGGSFGGDVTFDDAAGADWTIGDTPGTYRPTRASGRNGSGECTWSTSGIPGPAPAGPYGTTLASLDGSSADGTWRLFIQDNCGGDHGAISGWTLHLESGAAKEDGIFLCYSTFQVDPGVWSLSTAKTLVGQGYWAPYAVAGNPFGSSTVLGNGYTLVCNLPSTYTNTGQVVDDGGLLWGKDYADAHVADWGSLIGLYALFAPSSG